VHTAAKLTITWGSLQDEYLLSLPLLSDALLGKKQSGIDGQSHYCHNPNAYLEEVMRK
jgi:hypothetical protein